MKILSHFKEIEFSREPSFLRQVELIFKAKNIKLH